MKAERWKAIKKLVGEPSKKDFGLIDIGRDNCIARQDATIGAAPEVYKDPPIVLDPNEFENNPELKNKISDHQNLLTLRNKYLHVSYKCSWLGDNTPLSYMDPHSKSTRDAKLREEYDS